MSLFSKNNEGTTASQIYNGPKKTGIRLFFELLGRKFWKLIELNLLYSLFYIPLVLSFTLFFQIKNTTVALTVSLIMLLIFAVLVGPATAGMTKVMRNYVIERNAFMVSDFFQSFKENFGRAFVVGFVDVLICASVYSGFIIYPALARQYGSFIYVALVLTFSVSIVVAMMNFYAFLMIIATDLSFKDLLKNSFSLVILEMKKNLLTFIISLVIIVAVALLPIFVSFTFVFILPFFPAAFVWFIVCFNSYPIVQKYVINPYYTSIGKVNPELSDESEDDSFEPICKDMSAFEEPVAKRKKGKGKRIS